MAKSANLELELTYNSLPHDIALTIASFLSVNDVCVLGCSSRFWKELCGSDYIWMSLYKKRWPHPSNLTPNSTSLQCAWRSIYIKWHQVMADRATTLVKFVKERSHYESLEVGDYLRAIEDLSTMEFGFQDVQLFLFPTKQNVLLNLIGLHYSLFCLGIPAEDVMKALLSCQISERQVSVKWWKLGRWFHGFRLRDESRSCRVSLRSVALAKEEEVMGILQRGAIHEVLRVQISAKLPETTGWACV